MLIIFKEVLIPVDSHDLALFSYPDPLSKITTELTIALPLRDLNDWTPLPKSVNDIVFTPAIASS